MPSSTIRITPEEHDTLRALSRKTARPMASLLEEAIADLKRKFVLEATNRAYSAMRADKKAWTKYVAENAAWERSSLSDLKNGHD